jgi:hypothetical protein
MYGLMSNFFDWAKICIEKSKEFRKFWNCRRIELCSSADFRAKLREVHRTTERMPPDFNITIPSRISWMGMKFWVVCCFDAIV